MKIKWIIINKAKRDKKYHCYDEVYNTKEEAEEVLREARNKSTAHLWDFRKAKIFPINWGSIFNRGYTGCRKCNSFEPVVKLFPE